MLKIADKGNMECADNFYKYLQDLTKSTIVVFAKERQGMSERMKTVYQKFKNMSGADTRRLSPDEILAIPPAALSLNPHIFVLSNFEGEVFNFINNLEKYRFLLGIPLLERLFKTPDAVKKPMRPNHRQIFSPVFNGMTLCLSNIKTPQKKEIEKILILMSGRLSEKVDSSVTHLATNTTKSVKYSEAAERRLPIYHFQWVQGVWRKCLKDNNHQLAPDSSQFDVYKLPPFFDLKISCTGVHYEQKKSLQTLIEENGGEFAEMYSSTDTDILLMNARDSTNPKYHNATKRRIPILKCEWAEDSVKAGYSLAYEDYCFKTSISRDSTHKDDQGSESSQQWSLCSLDNSVFENLSADMASESECNFTATSVSTLRRVPSTSSTVSSVSSSISLDSCALKEKKTYIQFIKNFAVSQLKKLGDFLDGSTFYLKDFPEEIISKTQRIITRCGGSYVESLDETFTHLLCYGDVNQKSLYKFMSEHNKHTTPVHSDWLYQCLMQMKPLPDADFIIDLSAFHDKTKVVPPSPATRKSIKLMTFHENEKNDKRENAKALTPAASNFADDERVELKQTLIETNHKKIKLLPPVTAIGNASRRKRRSDEELERSTLRDSKRRRLFDMH